jgi:transposase InsO family protein
MTLTLIEEAHAGGARLKPACEVLGIDPRTLQRWRAREDGDRRQGPHSEPRNKLSPSEREEIREILVSPEYRDLTPHQIVPRLADEEQRFVGSESTMYRLLREEKLNVHRERSRPATQSRPREHCAQGPNEVFSWDITYLPTEVRGVFLYLYLMMDIWSRKIVGWAVHDAESSDHASRLFREVCLREGLDPDGLVLHSDNGSPMKGATMLVTLERLGVLASFSRPRVSNDNPFSEALFRTLKYRPEYPDRPFASIAEAEAWVTAFVRWYNTEHRHSAIRFVTPEQRHLGLDREILLQRHRIYQEAKQANPERWTAETRNWNPIDTVTLNPNPGQSVSRQAEAS